MSHHIPRQCLGSLRRILKVYNLNANSRNSRNLIPNLYPKDNFVRYNSSYRYFSKGGQTLESLNDGKINDAEMDNAKINDTKINEKRINETLENNSANESESPNIEFASEADCKLKLEEVCAQGDVEAARAILKIMKDRKFAVDERVFNALVLAHGISYGLSAAKEVLKTMRTAHVTESEQTYWALTKALALRGTFKNVSEITNETEIKEINARNKLEFTEALKGLRNFEPVNFFDVIFALGKSGNQSWLPELKNALSVEYLPKEYSSQLEEVCSKLISVGNVEGALDIYCGLARVGQDGGFGVFLLKEMLTFNIVSTSNGNKVKEFI